MKSSQKIVKRGDYYEFQTTEQSIPSSKQMKKQQLSNVQATDVIIDELPNFDVTCKKYQFFPQNRYQNHDTQQLKQLLQGMLTEKELKDQQKSQINKMLQEIKAIEEINVLPLNKWDFPTEQSKAVLPKLALKKLTLTANCEIDRLQERIKKIEKCDVEDLVSIQRQLEMLLNEKKLVVSPPSSGDKNKEEIQGLYNHLSSLTCLKNINGILDKIEANDGKYIQMTNWCQNICQITNLNDDYLKELQQDQLLIQKLQQQFACNIKAIQEGINNIKIQQKEKKK